MRHGDEGGEQSLEFIEYEPGWAPELVGTGEVR